ncbi:MAG: efflux RND transporter periplasmic adaptor subunit [Gemmatimonadetes bacterium]|nr:efflux RND transporter periplasmic adaptor subunit [Gemmatimonadota bacterium]
MATRDLERIRSVHATGALTVQRVEQAEQRAADATSRLESLRAMVSAGGREPASVVRAQAALDAARARVALTRVRAPADGVVLARGVEPGDAVSPGQGLLELALDGPAELVVFPGEENLAGLSVGAPATASADAFPKQTFEASVSLVAPSVDPTQGTVEVRLAVPAPPDYLLPDMTVSVNIETGRRPSALVLPEEVVQGLGTADPWVGVVRDGHLERQPVEIGLRATGIVEVLSGIENGEFVARGFEGVELGSRVRTAGHTQE